MTWQCAAVAFPGGGSSPSFSIVGVMTYVGFGGSEYQLVGKGRWSGLATRDLVVDARIRGI